MPRKRGWRRTRKNRREVENAVVPARGPQQTVNLPVTNEVNTRRQQCTCNARWSQIHVLIKLFELSAAWFRRPDD